MRIKVIIINLIFILLLLISCKSDKLEGYKNYENSSHNFTIQYPENWVMREGFGRDNENITGSLVVFQAPKEDKFDVFRENTQIFTEELPDSVSNVDEYLEYSKDYLPGQLLNFNIFEEGKENINGKESRKIYFSFESNLQLLHSLAYIFYINNKGYVVLSTARPESYMSFRRTFENISRSINFN